MSRQAVSREEALYVDILGAADEGIAFLKRVGEDVIRGKASVSHKDREAAIKVTVYQLAEDGKFIFQPAQLDDRVQIAFRKQVIQRNGMERIESLF